MDSDASIECEIWRPPLPVEQVRDVVELLWHKGAPWIGDIRRRLAGGMRGARDVYCIARRQDQLIGHAWYTVSDEAPELGLIGHIYTVPEFRRRGISARLMQMAMADFRQHSGRAMQLFTSTPYTLGFYERFGFENLYSNQAYHATDWYMCSPGGAYGQLQQATSAGHGQLHRLTAGMLPQFCLLYNLERNTRLKDRAQLIGLGLEAELAFIQTWEKLDSGRAVCYCHGDQHLLTGIATLSRLEFPHQAHIGIFDIYTAPDCNTHVGELADACLAARDDLGIEVLYAMAVDADKRRTFERLGFQPRTVLPRHFRVGADRYDVRVYGCKRAE